MTEAGDRRAQACASLRVDFSRAAGAAVLAPSVHNTQPWRFVIGSSTLQIHADRSRGLQVLDPTGRLLAISCGAAVLHAKLSLRASGRSAIVRLLPDDDDRDHLATIEVATASAPTAQELALAEAIANRHSQREPFSAMPVPMALAAALVGAADEEGAWLRPVEGNEELLVLATLLRHADWLQRTEPGYRAELREWLRTEPSTDGVPIWALAAAGVERGEILLREFDLDSSRVAARFHAGVVNAVEHPLLAILSTGSDGVADWVVAGQALARVLLAATAAGFSASILGQVVDLPATRSALRRRLALRGPAQVALRVGHGPLEARPHRDGHWRKSSTLRRIRPSHRGPDPVVQRCGRPAHPRVEERHERREERRGIQ